MKNPPPPIEEIEITKEEFDILYAVLTAKIRDMENEFSISKKLIRDQDFLICFEGNIEKYKQLKAKLKLICR